MTESLRTLGLATLTLTTTLAGCLQADPRCRVTFDVSVRLAGASPELVERELVDPLEADLKAAPGLAEIHSTASFDLAVLTLEFEPGRDGDEAMRWVHERLKSTIRVLPQDASYPEIGGRRETCPR
ncbi:efflux RND transporter permease subunit [Nannocystaceae bacterium ST9]